MRRTAAVLATTALVLTTSPAAPSYAEDSTVVVHTFDWPEEVGGFTERVCGDPLTQATEQLLMHVQYSTAPNPLGERMQGFDTSGEVAIGPIAITDTPSTASWTLDVEPQEGSTTGYAVAFYFPPGSDGQSYYFGYDEVSVGGTEWTTLDSTDDLLDWTFVQQGTPSGGEGSATLAQFVADHGGDGQPGSGAYLGYILGCDGNRFFYDRLVLGGPDGTTTYDFEGTSATPVMQTADRTITAGGKVAVKGLPDAEHGFEEVELVLEARTFGSDDFVEVGRATSVNEDAGQVPAGLAVRPKRRTEYRWVLEDTAQTDGGTSEVVVVEVRRKVTLALADVTLKKGQDVVAKGKATPAGRRIAIRLERKTASGWKTIDQGRTRTDGTYRLEAPVSGHAVWKLRTVAAASAGNLEGTSPVRQATVG